MERSCSASTRPVLALGSPSPSSGARGDGVTRAKGNGIAVDASIGNRGRNTCPGDDRALQRPVPPLATATRKCTGRESNPYASRRRNLKPGWRPRILWGSRKQAPAAIRVGPKCGVLAPAWGNPDARGTGEDQVEAALARALDRASEAGRFDVVAQLARELEALRLAHLTNDVAFTDARGASRRAVMTDGRNLCVWCRGGRQPDRGPE